MLSRRSALAVLGTAGLGTAVFQRALAATAQGGPVTPQMVADAEWVAGIKLTEPAAGSGRQCLQVRPRGHGTCSTDRARKFAASGASVRSLRQSSSTSRSARLRGQAVSGSGLRSAVTAQFRRGFGVQFHSAAWEASSRSKDLVGGIDEVVFATNSSLR